MRFISANKVFNGKQFLSESSVVIVDNRGIILDVVLAATIDPLKIEAYNGILCPGFVNAHCHLELSHLKSVINEAEGLIEFAKGVIQQRGKFSEEQIKEHLQDADREMHNNGIVAVGDISNTSHSFSTKASSKLYYHTFIELIGLNPQHAKQLIVSGEKLLEQLQQFNLEGSLVPHAPYSVSSELLQAISQLNSTQPFTIHNQESREEEVFFKTKTGQFTELYKWLNVPIDFFEATGKSSLQSIVPYLNKHQKSLLVHNTYTSLDDIDIAIKQHSHLYWCLCPNANWYIERQLPDITQLSEHTHQLCIGTDSLASNYQLSITEEIKRIQQHYPTISFEKLLQWSTYNGAVFLGIEHTYGTLEKGKQPGLNVLNEKLEVKRLV